MKFLSILVLLLCIVAFAAFIGLGFVDIPVDQSPITVDISEKLVEKL